MCETKNKSQIRNKNKSVLLSMQLENSVNLIEKFYIQLINIIKKPDLYNPSLLPKLYESFFFYVSHLGLHLSNHIPAIIEECFTILKEPVDIEEYLSITSPKTKKELSISYYFIPNPPENRILYVTNANINNFCSCFKIIQKLSQYKIINPCLISITNFNQTLSSAITSYFFIFSYLIYSISI